MPQAKGGKAAIVMGFESTFNTLPSTPPGVVLPINSFNLKAEQALKTPETMTGRRDPVEPYAGFVACSGDASVPLDAVAFGYWLKALLGDPVSVQDAAKNIGAGPAVNKGNGKVGIPLTAHGIPVGASIVVAGTTSYNGTYTVDATTSVNEIVITKAYTAETFAAGTVRATIYTHTFKVPDSQPSMYFEKRFADISQFEVFTGCKLGKLGIRAGGDGELVASLGIEGANALAMAATTALTGTITNAALARFLFDGAYLYEGGSLMAKATEVSLDYGANLDTDVYPLSNQGMRGDLPEGVISVGGSLKAMFNDATLLDKGRSHTNSALKLEFRRVIEKLTFECQEIQFSRTSVPVDTPKGLYANMTWQGFFGSGAGDSSMIVTLVNQVASY